jgi:thymidylate synthase ThyX
MGQQVKLLASSLSEDTGIRLDTFQVRYWRPIHGEVMTHRVFSRNASSSRAIPAASIWAREEVCVPRFRKNKPGMQPGDYLSDDEQAKAATIWLELAKLTQDYVQVLADKDGLNIHKQWVNRPTEWYSYIDVLISSTEWSNFDALRVHPDAQDEIHALAAEMQRIRLAATPAVLPHGQWHLPYVGEEDFDDVSRMLKGRARPDGVQEVLAQLGKTRLDLSPRNAILVAMSAARCCRVSYAKHDGSRPTIAEDMQRYLQLAGSSPIHASPLEHQARPLLAHEDERHQGNFVGWAQFRKFLPHESQ